MRTVIGIKSNIQVSQGRHEKKIENIFLVCFFILCYAKGESVASRIVNGTQAEKGRYPYMVSLISVYNNKERHECGGVVIAPKFILTAAHCATKIRKAQIGRYNLHKNEVSFSETLTFSNEEQRIYHPDYNIDTKVNDLMIIELDEGISEELYAPIILDDNTQNLSDGVDVTVMGWGKVAEDGYPSGILLETEVDIVSNNYCKSVYGSKITDGHLCASRDGSDSCKKDSGGPLILKGDIYTSDILVGIVSWGQGCARPGYPGVYIRVSEHLAWIKNITQIGAPSISPTSYPTSSMIPSQVPSSSPSASPSSKPSTIPSIAPFISPSEQPSFLPSTAPSSVPSSTHLPSSMPSFSPTSNTTKPVTAPSWSIPTAIVTAPSWSFPTAIVTAPSWSFPPIVATFVSCNDQPTLSDVEDSNSSNADMDDEPYYNVTPMFPSDMDTDIPVLYISDQNSRDYFSFFVFMLVLIIICCCYYCTKKIRMD